MSQRMRSRPSRRTVVAGALAASGCATIGNGGGPGLDALIADIARHPRAMRDGSDPYSDDDGALLPDNSYDYHVDSAARVRQWLASAHALRARSADADAVETIDALIWDLNCDAALAPYYWHPFPLAYANSQMARVTSALSSAAQAEEIDQASLLEAGRQAPGFIDNITLRLTTQIERNLTVPAAEAQRALETVRSARARLATLGETLEQNEGGFARDLSAQLRGPIAASAERLARYLEQSYLPAVDERSRLPLADDAHAYHAALINLRTSHAASPDEELAIAREDLARAEEDLARMRRSLGADPDMVRFHQALGRDPRWIARDADDVQRRLDEASTRIAPYIPRLFHRMPSSPGSAAPLPDALSTTRLNGYYQEPTTEDPRGTYYFNTYQLDTTSWMWAAPLIFHELSPGHHVQLATVFESTTLSHYRKSLWVPGYVEGWGEYARQLAEECGVYEEDPWGLYASRLLERRFTLRSVEDLSVHDPAWTWQASERRYATDPLTRPSTTVQLALASSIMRSSGTPYWRGLKEFLALRAQAQSFRGAGFDIRDFHEVALSGGALPFPVLEQRLRRYGLLAPRSEP
ncbi:MAG: DUF885 domain-containing protein [Hyphomonadaceae bacterium]